MLRQRRQGKGNFLPPSNRAGSREQEINEPSVVEDDSSNDQADDVPGSTSGIGFNTGPRKAMKQEEVAKDEGKLRKLLVRLIAGLVMVRCTNYFLHEVANISLSLMCTSTFFTDLFHMDIDGCFYWINVYGSYLYMYFGSYY